MARKLSLVPILVIACFVTVLDSPAKNGNGNGYGAAPAAPAYGGGWEAHKPAGTGDGRRIK